MATIKSKTHKGLSLNVQYDYITLKTPNGNFTRNRYGSKSTGNLAMHPTAFGAINAFIEKMEGMTLQQSMERLLEPSVLKGLFPEFDAEVPQFSIGDTVRYKGGHREFAGLTGVVRKVKNKNVFIQSPWRVDLIGFDKTSLEKA